MLSKIFKAYDVRGVYNKDLTDEITYKIGKAFVSFLKCKDVVVGYDMRLSSPKLSKAFMKGVNDEGADAVDIGQVSTDGLYFASGFLQKPAVMFTASHNPPEWNGMKFCREKAVPINEDTGLQRIKSIIEKNKFEKLKKIGKVVKKNILKDYVKHVLSFIHKDGVKNLKIAVDAGNGMAGKIVPLVYKNLNVQVVPLYFKLDGRFPNHPADPTKYENLKELQKVVKEKKCDFGMAFDGDADRILFVDENGNIVNGSITSALIIKSILKKHKNEKIIYSLVCSKIVPETIEKYGGKVIMTRVGHSFMKDTMRENKAIFGCEHSAHYYFKHNFNADSGIIASLIISEIISKENKRLSELLKEFEVYYKIEETNFEVADKISKIKEIKQYYKKKNPKKIMTMDGVSVYFDDYWFNVRPSNTEPLLRLNLEAVNKELMEEKTKEVVGVIKR
jgi:phosphomannomutase|tara:strand:+ start:6659 stop:7999 length:1341 start_codon:yes stop_codon:yes gene_type:complete